MYKRQVLRTTDYIEIGKMCFLPDFNDTQCFGSIVISQMVKWLKANTRYLYLYTLADGIMGKCGYVYQASNFQYVGSFTTSVYRDSLTGEKIHPRSARLLLEENAAFDGCLLYTSRGLRPFLSPKYDLKKHPNYKYTAEADKKRNAFRLEKLISTRLKLNPEEVYEVYGAGDVDSAEDDILNYDDLDDPDAFA